MLLWFCCVDFVPKHVCNQLSQLCPNFCVWFVLLWFVVWALSQNVFATTSPKFVPIVLFGFCCCALSCELCPKTCLQPTVPMLSQLLCVISVAVMCCLNFVPTHVCSQLSQFCPICSACFRRDLASWCDPCWLPEKHMLFQERAAFAIPENRNNWSLMISLHF